MRKYTLELDNGHVATCECEGAVTIDVIANDARRYMEEHGAEKFRIVVNNSRTNWTR